MKIISIKNKKTNIIALHVVRALIALISLIAAFGLTELYNDNYIWTMDSSIIRLNLYVYVAVFSIVFLIFDSVKTASCATLFVAWLFSTVNHYVFVFRGSPLRAADIFSVSTAADVAGHYSFVPDVKTIGITAVFVIFIALCGLIEGAINRENKKEKKSPKRRLLRAVFSLVAIVYVIFFFFFSGKIEKWGMSTTNVYFQDVYETYGTALTFTLTIKDIIPQTPSGYGMIAVNDIVNNCKQTAENAETGKIKPNVIVVVNESFSDLQTLGNIETDSDTMPFLHSLTENTVKGEVYASVFGGNTANSEFEFLTGNTMAFQAPGTVVFQSLSGNQESIVKTFEKNGYTCLNAYHPGKRKSWNRVAAYESIGFKEFYDATMFDEISTIRGYADDECLVDEIIGQFETYDKDSDAPVFIYTMSIQNHGGYEGGFEDLDRQISVTNPAYKDESLELYLNLIKKSDTAMERLLAYFEKCSEPTIVLIFGDHQPKLEGDINSRIVGGDEIKKYCVPFYIWANYDIEKQSGINTSINYLGSTLLGMAGCEMSGYERYLSELSKDIPVITANGYYGADGSFYELKDESSPYYEKVRDYSFLQYANMYDKGCAEEFFGN